MKKYISICACMLLIICSFASTVFAANISSNSLSDQITLACPDSEGSCTITYSVAVDQESDWNMELIDDAGDNVSGVTQTYDAYIEPGSTITAQVSCAEDTRVHIAFALYDSNVKSENVKSEIIDEISSNNGLGGGGSQDLSYTVPDTVGGVQVYMTVLPTQNTYGTFDGFMTIVNLYVDDGEAQKLFP